jgi:hypothetical protein
MKSLLFASIAILFGLIPKGFTQITITDSDMFKLGDTVRVSEAIDPNFDYLTTGQGIEWDFSNLQANWQRLIDPFDPQGAGFFVNMFFGPGSGNYQAEYYQSLELPLDQAGQVLPVEIDDAYRFTRITSDSLTYVGIAVELQGNIIAIRSDTIEKVYEYPLTYGDSYNSRGYTNGDFNPLFDVVFRQYRQRETEVDGYGTVITPFGTFQCIRLHHVIDELDSIYLGFGIDNWVPIQLPQQHVYEWWANGQLYPIVRVEVQNINGDDVITDIFYKDIYLGLDASLNELATDAFSIYPNPAREEINVAVEGAIQKVLIIDMQGRTIFEEAVDLHSIKSINIARLPQGLYMLRVESDKGFGQRKFFKH